MTYIIIWSLAGVVLAYALCLIASYYPEVESFLDASIPTQLVLLAICGPLTWYAVAWFYTTAEHDSDGA